MGVLSLMFFIVWPLGALIFSLKNYSSKWTKNIIWLFVIFYGYTFVLFNETMDANRLKLKFEFFHNSNLDLFQVIQYFFIDNREGVDIIQPIIFYFTSIFTNDFQVLMAVFALIFGFFYSRNICYLIDRSEGKINIYNYLILGTFILVVGFWNINGFRFWTAAHMLFYAVIPFIYEGSRRRLWLLPFIILLHFAYLLPTLIFLLFPLIKRRERLIFYFFVVSFLIGTVNTEAVGEILMKILPSTFEYKIRTYTSADYAQEVLNEEASMSAMLRKLMFIAINIYFIVVYKYYLNKIKYKKNLYNLFMFCLIIVSVGNLASLIPSGGRFLIVSALFSLSFLFFYIQQTKMDQRFRVLLQLGTPLFFFASIGYIRLGLNTINEFVIIGNPIVTFFTDSGRALIEWF